MSLGRLRYCGDVAVFALGTMPAGQGTPPGFVPGGFCAVPLLGVVELFAPFAEACAEVSVLPLVFSPVGGFAPAALTHGVPVRFAVGLVVAVLPGA